MPMNKSKGNMYEWVTHTHSHLGGHCSHACSYCYVSRSRFGRPKRYEGELRFIEEEFNVNYGHGKKIFLENCNDLFALEVPHEMILRVLTHCKTYPNNTYIFQTKNPLRYYGFLQHLPPSVILGTTIETNRKVLTMAHSKAPEPSRRKEGMARISRYPGRVIETFVTIEPIMDFDVSTLVDWIHQIAPTFVNIGADSKGTNLSEPSREKVNALIQGIKGLGIEIRKKINLNRLLPEKEMLQVDEKPPAYVPPPPKIKILHEEIRYCAHCIYCHESHSHPDGAPPDGISEWICTRAGRPFKNDIHFRESDTIPDWCPLPDKEDEKRGTGAPVPTGPTGR